MRTNIVLDDKLVNEALKLTKIKTKKDLVNFALKELVEKYRKKRILKLEGKVEWSASLEKLRKNRFDIS